MVKKIFSIIFKIVNFVKDRFYDLKQIIKIILLFGVIFLITICTGACLGVNDIISLLLTFIIFISILYFNRNFNKIKMYV